MKFNQILTGLLFITMLFGQVGSVKAADYYNKWQSQSEYLNMVAGQTEQVWLEVVNNGTLTWYKNGDHPVHLGTAEPLDRNSQFYDAGSWLTPNRIEMVQDKVAPGETARFAFKIKAPNQNGYFKEYFRLVAEGVTWLNNQGIYWQWNVMSGDNFEDMCMSRDQGTTQSTCTMPEGWMYESSWSGQSDYLTLSPGETAEVWIKYKNTGEAVWYQNGDFATHLGTANPIDRASSFYDSAWLSSNRIAMEQSQVKPGEEARFRFRIKAPTKAGKYYEYFRPVVENVSWLNDQGVYLLFEVKDGNNDSNSGGQDNSGNNNVISEGTVQVSCDQGMEIYQGDEQKLLGTAGAGTIVAVDFANWVYTVQAGSSKYTANDYIQLKAKNNGILKVESYNDVKSWGSGVNDNLFRDTIEIRYSGNSDQVWVINELPLEDYLAGVAESSNSSPLEYLKAISVAERTYAIYHLNRGGRHPENYVDLYNSVNGNGDDQVYRGYGFEQRNTNVVQAVKATTGKVVKYNGNIAVTPYFSQSDGRTRSWSEVWGGNNYPWCVSVDDPYNEGQSLLGHGVGMSASGARQFAEKDGKTYDWILKYYYTGIDIADYQTSGMRMRVGIYHV